MITRIIRNKKIPRINLSKVYDGTSLLHTHQKCRREIRILKKRCIVARIRKYQ